MRALFTFYCQKNVNRMKKKLLSKTNLRQPISTTEWDEMSATSLSYLLSQDHRERPSEHLIERLGLKSGTTNQLIYCSNIVV